MSARIVCSTIMCMGRQPVQSFVKFGLRVSDRRQSHEKVQRIDDDSIFRRFRHKGEEKEMERVVAINLRVCECNVLESFAECDVIYFLLAVNDSVIEQW